MGTNGESEADPFDGLASDLMGASELSELVALSAEKVVEWKKKGIDCRAHRVVIHQLLNGQQQRREGIWAPAEVSEPWLREKFGAGSYTVVVYNAANQVLAKNPCHILGPAIDTSSPKVQAEEPLEKMLMRRVLEQALNPRTDPMREVVASIATLVQTQSAMFQQFAQLQMQMLAGNSKDGGGETSKLLHTLVGGLVQKQNAAPANGQRGTIEEFLAVMQFGMKLAAGVSKGAKSNPDDAEDTKWIEVVPQIVDSIGPGLAATVAQAILPKDKADSVIATIQEHMKARQAEAEAAPIETDGATLP